MPPFKTGRRAALMGAGAALITRGVRAQEAYPARPIRMIIPFPAGGPTDVYARLYAERLGRELGQPVVTENRGGAGGAIGSLEVSRARADGYTILFGTASTHALYPLVTRQPQFDVVRDFTTIAELGGGPLCWLAHPSRPATLQEFLAAARTANPTLSYGSPGSGTIMHLATELLKQQAGGVAITHVPYRGAAPAHIDLAGGRVHMIFDNIPQALALARDGKVRALAVTGAQRSPQAPEIPALAEFLPGFDISSWGGVCAPAGISPALIRRINELTKQSLDSEDIKKRFYDNGATTWYTTPEEFVKFRADNEAAFAPLIRASGAKVD